MSTDQGSFHKALQWVLLVWCPQFSDTSPSKCPPTREMGKIHATLEHLSKDAAAGKLNMCNIQMCYILGT